MSTTHTMNITRDTLREDEIFDYLRFATSPNTPDEVLQKRAASIRDEVQRGARSLNDTLILRSDDPNTICAAVRTFQEGRSLHVLRPSFQQPTDDLQDALLQHILQRAQDLNATLCSTRVITPASPPTWEAALQRAGFAVVGQRVEYKSDVASLPSNEGNPLRWVGMDSLGVDFVADVMRAVAVGDPDSDPTEDPHQAIQVYLNDPELTHDPSMFQVGFEGDEPVALTIVQIEPSSGWSRITYMGLVPSARGRGLGTWLHRQGFDLIRAQGGTLYHGGTHAENTAMIRLFESHNCTLYHRMTVYAHDLST